MGQSKMGPPDPPQQPQGVGPPQHHEVGQDGTPRSTRGAGSLKLWDRAEWDPHINPTPKRGRTTPGPRDGVGWEPRIDQRGKTHFRMGPLEPSQSPRVAGPPKTVRQGRMGPLYYSHPSIRAGPLSTMRWGMMGPPGGQDPPQHFGMGQDGTPGATPDPQRSRTLQNLGPSD